MPKSNSWFPSAAAVTPSALYTSVTLLPWKRFEISVPWKASPAARTMPAPPGSFASARMASRYPPNQSAPPISLPVLEAIHFGAATSRIAPCVSLTATIVSLRPTGGTPAFAGDGALASATTRRENRRRIADAIRCHNHLTRRIEVGTNCVLCPRIPSYAWDMRAGAAVSRAEDVRLAARDAATRALGALGRVRVAGGGVAVEGGLLLDHDLAYAHAVGAFFPAPGRLAVAQSHQAIGKPLLVTRSEGRALLELDSRPAMEALSSLAEQPGLDGEALQFVALGLSPRPGEPFSVEDFVSVPLLGIDEERGALETGAPIPEGHSVSFTLRDGMGARRTLQQALDKLRDPRPSWGLYFDCASRGDRK